jgi:hypothetical protein
LPSHFPYCEGSDPEIDSVSAERSLWGIALWRKKWLLLRSDKGGRTAAIVTSFVATCKRLQINPFTYVRDGFDRISTHPINRLAQLLPDNWKLLRKPPPTSSLVPCIPQSVPDFTCVHRTAYVSARRHAPPCSFSEGKVKILPCVKNTADQNFITSTH